MTLGDIMIMKTSWYNIGYTLIGEFVLSCVWTELTFTFVSNLMILLNCVLWWHWNLYGLVCEYRWTWVGGHLDNFDGIDICVVLSIILNW